MLERACFVAAAVCAAGLAACGGDITQIGSSANAQWYCNADSQMASCTAAIPKVAGEQGAYACNAGDAIGACPPSIAVSPLQAVVPQTLWPYFDKLPWACLLTGEHERTCTRSIEHARIASTATPTIPSNTPEDDVSSPPPPKPEPGNTPPTTNYPSGIEGVKLPTDCKPASWEQYFCQHATASYRKHGIDIQFPCKGVFDANGSLVSAAVNTATAPTTPGAPSCLQGEVTMRAGAWLDAVARGCLSLSGPILAMCQQAVAYAPTTKKCNLTGTW